MSRESERIELRAEKARLKATDPAELAEAWTMVTGQWSETVAHARLLPDSILHESVKGEWSFIETQRHLVMATDCWLRRMVKGMADAYHPWGMSGPWLKNPRHWGLDPDANPTLDQVLEVRRERMAEVDEIIVGATPSRLERICHPPNTPGHPRKDHTVLQCLHVVLAEEWHHHRYAIRDLAVLEKRVAADRE